MLYEIHQCDIFMQIAITYRFFGVSCHTIDATVQLRCNFTLTREQFTRACIELLVASVLLPARNSRKIIE